MLFVWIFLILGAVFIIALVDFVLRNPMFAETFVVKIGIPFTQVEFAKEDVGFIYIITGSLLLGALIIAVSTWVLDAKRKFKVRNLRKELKQLQNAVEEAKALLPQQEEEADEDAGTDVTEESFESPEASLGPEEITKSFENAVEGGDFLEEPLKKEESAEGKESDARDVDTEKRADEEGRLPQNTAVEAEIIESAELPQENESVSEDVQTDKKKASDEI